MYEPVSQTTFSYYPVHPNLPHPIHNSNYNYNNNNNPIIQSQPVPDPINNYGAYPVTSYPHYDPQSYYYPDPNATYAAAQPNQAVASASRGTSRNNSSFGQFPRVSRKKQKKPIKFSDNGSATQTVLCTVCKIECASIQQYEKHVRGKKHNKTLKMMYVGMMPSVGQSSQSGNNSIKTSAGSSSAPTDLEAKKQKLVECGTAAQSLRICSICNVACNGEVVFSTHIAGKKHISQERALSAKTNPNTIPVSNPRTNSQSTTEKTTVVGQAYCEVCKISCTSSESLAIHRQGKKHKKNLENLCKSISVITPSSVSSIPVESTSVPTAVVDKVVAVQGIVPKSEPVKKKGARSVEPVDLETKKRRVLECGADAGNVRMCTLCNVVCNSELVFTTHLAGHKHASLVRRTGAGVAPNNQPGL